MNFYEISSKVKTTESYSYKIIVIGDSGVGKSNFIKRFIDNEFKSESISTVGCALYSILYEASYFEGNHIKRDIIKINIWDTAGQERYKSVTSSYYKGSHGIFVLYDTTKKETFKNTDDWIQDIQNFCNNEPSIMLVGTKSDLYSLKIIETEDLNKKAETNSK